jgi:branched-chain amino acid transport system substrate-binding protein
MPGTTRQQPRRSRAVPRLLVSALLTLITATLAGCGGGSSSSVSKGPLTVGVYQPFTGADAVYGAEGQAVCDTGAQAINAAGGVLGHKFGCTPFDSSSDPADALPVANRMVASTKNLVMIYGPTSVEPAVEPILNTFKIVHLADDGDPRYDHQTSPYFLRILPSDSLAGVALAVYAAAHGWTHAASVFANDAAAQTSVPSLHSTYPKVGGTLSTSLTLVPGQTSYRTEVERVLQSKPDAIITEMDPQTAAAFFSEMRQLNSNKLPPIVTTSGAFDPAWIGAILKVVGKNTFEHDVVAIAPTPGTSNRVGYNTFVHALKTAPQSIPGRSQYTSDPFGMVIYDGIQISALAMLEAKSVDSKKWAPLVLKIANGTAGAVTVHSFAEGRQAIANGKAVHYIGAAGPLQFNRWNNLVTPFSGYRYNGNGTGVSSLVPTAGTVTPAQLSQAESR